MAGDGPSGQCEAWARLGAEFRFNEMRACWKMGGQPLAQRLHDKPRSWANDGLNSLIPESIAQGLIGHSFNCPDMIGGGELDSFRDGAPLDQELFVRFAQCSALFPMMQFSLAPWRVLDDRHLSAVLAAVNTRQALMPDLSRLFDHAARTGEPILVRLPTTSRATKPCMISSCSARRFCAPRSWSPAPPSVMWLFRPVAGATTTDQSSRARLKSASTFDSNLCRSGGGSAID